MVRKTLDLEILRQPDATTCGPTCLHAIYRYYGNETGIDRLIADVPKLKGGGTLAVHLARHALKQGYAARIYTYNLQLFDPSWFEPGVDLIRRMKDQLAHKESKKLQLASKAYIDFLKEGGELRYEDLNPALIRRFLDRGAPILTGLSSTYLYRTKRERGDTNQEDDVRGVPTGHFVVICGYDRDKDHVLIADPWSPNPLSRKGRYGVALDRLIGAILLGILTYDANLLIIEPK